jgi:hypothetical protein
MVWVKRNLGLVIGGVIALALLVVAALYFWSNYKHDQEVTARLDETTEKFKSLLNRPLQPGGEGAKINNIELVKEENQRLEHFLQDVRGKFGKREIPTNISNRDFRALLDNTVHDLQRTADSLGITVPGKKDYWFTFAPEKAAVEFKNIEMLTHELMDVKDLCDILFTAKISDLVGIKRVPASSEDNNSTDFLPSDKKATTNEVAVVTPYELRFQGFSSELARVLDRVIAAKRCFVVRSVAVDKAPSAEEEAANAVPVMNPMMLRYGGRYGMMPPPAQPVTTAPKRPANVLLDENKLLMVLQVEAVRLKEAPATKPAARPAKQVAQAEQQQ